jgi:dihydroorotase-like cyclic amidohydrolase
MATPAPRLERFPGLVDVHVHLREPGPSHKEGFVRGSRAALMGGFTFIIDMPNNPGAETVTTAALERKIQSAAEKALCDVGFHYGAARSARGDNTSTFNAAASNPAVFGLKIYCNHTTGNLLIDDLAALEKIFQAWPPDKPILVHAEGAQLGTALALADFYGQRLHVCHIARAAEVELVRQAKKKRRPVTAGVCPHHLYLTENDVKTKKSFAIMKPALGSQGDQDSLWEGLQAGVIDIVETDHAPHTREEKEADSRRAQDAGEAGSADAYSVFGIPGLETALQLMMLAVHDGRLSHSDIPRLLSERPREIFRVPEQKDTYVEIEADRPFEVPDSNFESGAKWSPFSGMTVYGRVTTVVLRGRRVVADARLTI